MSKPDDGIINRPGIPPEINRYLFPGENVKLHLEISYWKLADNVLWLFLALFAWIGLVVFFPAIAGSFAGVIIAIVIFAYPVFTIMYEVLDLSNETFIVTDRRLMLVQGIQIFGINLQKRQVNIMPLAKVTDMRYERDAWGRLLNYGSFIFESAGQDQALSRINYVIDPDTMYRSISALIFAPAQRRAFDKLLPRSTGTALPISEPDDGWWKR